MRITDATKPSVARFLSDPLGAAGWEFGIVGADYVIQVRDLDGTTTVAASAAAGLAAATPVDLELRCQDGVYSVYVNGSSSAAVTHTNSTATYARYRHWGLASSTDGANVQRLELCALVPIYADYSDVLIAFIGSDIWYSLGTGGVALLKANVMNGTGRVRAVFFNGKVYAVDGTHAIKIDLSKLGTATDPVSSWGGTTAATALPGATEASPGVFTAGTTRMTLIEVYQGRIVLSGDKRDPQNLWMSAAGDPDDFNTGDNDNPGRAFGTSTDFPGRIGEPITCLKQAAATGGLLLVGCINSVWKFEGEPTIGLPSISPRMLGVGVSGADAMWLQAEGRVIAHTPEGVYLIPSDGEPIPLSNQVITEGLTLPRNEWSNYIIQVRRDVRRQHTLIFRTPIADDGSEALHFAYDELTGRWQRRGGGFWPQYMPSRLGPMASCEYQGRLVMLTREGTIIEFDDESETDDGTAIASALCTAAVRQRDQTRETILEAAAVTLASDSDPATVTCYAGATVEEAYNGPRTARWRTTRTPAQNGTRIPLRARAPALVLDITATSGRIKVEEVHGLAQAGLVLTARTQRAAAAPPAPCRTADDPVHPPGSTTPLGTGPGPGVPPSPPTEDHPIVSSDPWDFGVEDDPAVINNPDTNTPSIPGKPPPEESPLIIIGGGGSPGVIVDGATINGDT